MRRLFILLLCQRAVGAKEWSTVGTQLLSIFTLTNAFRCQGPSPLVPRSRRERHPLRHFSLPFNQEVTLEEEAAPLQNNLHATQFSSKPLIEQAEDYLEDNGFQNVATAFPMEEILQEGSQNNEISSRRLFISAAMFGLGAAININAGEQGGLGLSSASAAETLGKLKWEATPVNKRTGVTVFDAEKDGYNLAFVTYLSRFLLCFDNDCQRWWFSKAAEIPRLANSQQIESIRYQQFAAFSASVEVGLQLFSGPDGPKQLLASLIKRYCPDLETIRAQREEEGLTPLGPSAEAQELREIDEARRQLAILFGLMEKNQPVDEITTILAAIDNGSIASIDVVDGGAGYAPGYGAPFVQFPPPDAGPDYDTATGRAELVPNGKLLRLDVVNRGFGYTKPPTVTISPPEVLDFSNGTASMWPAAKRAEGKAVIFKSGPNKGRVERIVLTDPGEGYTDKEIIKVKLSPPEMSPREGGMTATATAVPEYSVGGITIVDGGSGYAVEMPITVLVEPPPPTARVNMNDPLIAGMIDIDQVLPDTTVPTKEMKRRMPEISDPSSPTAAIYKLSLNGGKGGGGGCIGRACYDKPVQVLAYARAKRSQPLNENDVTKTARMEAELMRKVKEGNRDLVSGSSSGPGNYPLLPKLGSVSSSANLLALLPEGIGLQYDKDILRYIVKATPEVLDKLPAGWFDGSSNRPLDPEFGPRGRSPIEREKTLGVDTYLRFVASGAVCCSAVHLALTPIDVVKTKVQTNPAEYPGVVRAFQKILKSGGASSFFAGWAPTFVGFFVWGGVSYASTEYLRRLFTGLAGIEAANLEVPIILGASAISATIGSFILCPFEAVRIRSVALSGSGKAKKSILGVVNKMIDDEGISSLFSAIPAFLAKEIPFNMAKFTIFDLSTAAMYDAFPVAREDIQLSLIVSLAGGTLGGVCAAVVSNPADATITEMKKAKSKRSPIETFQALVEEGGPPRLFAGVSLRMVFYSLIVSLQFLVYDTVRFALGIGSDDLKLYLDVLGGALSETGGPV